MIADAKRSLNNFRADSGLLKEDEYLEVVSKLNEQQKAIFSDFVERISNHQEEPFYMYIGGNAGKYIFYIHTYLYIHIFYIIYLFICRYWKKLLAESYDKRSQT